jgi:hypothetical protein
MSIHLRPLLAVALSASMIAPALAREVGDVQGVTRSAFGTPPNAAKEAKRLGDPVADHEWLETLSASGLKVRLADGSQLTLGADSKVLVDNFVYDPSHTDSDAAAKAALSMSLGFMRYVTGSMPKGHTVIETPMATMTLRGTAVTIAVQPSGNTHLSVDEGEVTVRSKLTGQEMTVGAGSSVDIKPEEIRKDETGEPASNGRQQQRGNDQRRGGRDSGGASSGGSESGSDSSDSSDSGSSGG